MKKTVLAMLMVLGFVIKEPVYEKIDEYVRCVDYSSEYENMYVERVYFVKEGLLMKLVEYDYIPFSYYESVGIDVEEAYHELMDGYVYRGYLHAGYESMAPYYDSSGIFNPYLVVDFTNLDLFSVDEVPNDVKTNDRNHIIFDLYFKKFEKNDDCSLK